MQRTFRARLRTASAAADIVWEELPVRARIGRDRFEHVLNRPGVLLADELLALSKATGASMEWLRAGRGPMRAPSRSKQATQALNILGVMPPARAKNWLRIGWFMSVATEARYRGLFRA
jgi:hypothetical protein